ncbi:hypothetical protein PoB_004229200 [Plakobranchus ocellatus]|uniref:Uncharacterized protein n=1 Tax=Plakobranchus ocellatus TaxID=259542 RepID=A0AAV4B8I5_9GAST|nr:hypothetical protein PoB_004229200 [Plakobranchus ocellatus]
MGCGSGGSSGKAVGYYVRGLSFESLFPPRQFFIAPLCPPSTKWLKVKTARQTLANYLRMPYDMNNQDPNSDAPVFGPSMGFSLPLTIRVTI